MSCRDRAPMSANLEMHFGGAGAAAAIAHSDVVQISPAPRAPRFPAGTDLITAGLCPIKTERTLPMACLFCEFGHLMECHYPARCADARCSHYEMQQALDREAADAL